MNNTITYLKDISAFKFVLGGFFSLVGFYNIFFVGSGMAIIHLCLAFYLFLREGSEINVSNKTYRTIHSFFGIKYGSWKPIPAFEYVSVFKTSETQQVNVTSASARVKSQVILLNLFYDKNRHITFYKTQQVDDAFKVAKHFQSTLGIDILDATEREKKWL